jgi:salicylate hydroxylase
VKSEENNWTTCLECQGLGKKRRRLRKKVKLRYQRELLEFEKANSEGTVPARPRGHLEECLSCNGSGLLDSAIQTSVDTEKFPHLAIIGGGIGGVALAVACLHRGIPFTLFERDSGFETRSQGYGLTLQQASRAIEGLGVFSLPKGVISTKHVVHTTDGKVLGEWGIRKWGPSDTKTAPKRTNIHIARQSLRLALLEQLGGYDAVQWAHQLVDFNECEGEQSGVNLRFQIDGGDNIKHVHADLVVGADGIRSTVRSLLIGEDNTPLRYLGCIVILGICPLANIEGLDIKEVNLEDIEHPVLHPLLDGATVFQTANGHERMYMMPFTADSVMWQLSFPMSENEAKALSMKGVQALKEEACKRCQWHDPIPQILAATLDEQVSGYPVYDRELLTPESLAKRAHVTLIGDAAHPMSPFKGQGANQALLDALALARGITQGCRPQSQWRNAGVRESVLAEFEREMLLRVSAKVKGSAEAAQFLHSDVVLHEGNEPRGRVLLREDAQKTGQNKE